MATVGRGAEQFTVRFPDGLRDRIKVAAESNGRSMNAEIVATLEDAYPEDDGDYSKVISAVIRDGQPRTAKMGGQTMRIRMSGTDVVLEMIKETE